MWAPAFLKSKCQSHLQASSKKYTPQLSQNGDKGAGRCSEMTMTRKWGKQGERARGILLPGIQATPAGERQHRTKITNTEIMTLRMQQSSHKDEKRVRQDGSTALQMTWRRSFFRMRHQWDLRKRYFLITFATHKSVHVCMHCTRSFPKHLR